MVDIIGTKGPADPPRDGTPVAVDPEDIYDDVTAAVTVRTFDAPRKKPAADVRIEAAHLQPSIDDALETGFLLNNRFKIVELVHSGGMGHVYKAIDERRHVDETDQAFVAIKMMRNSLTPQVDARLALEREAAKTQRLAHPNIVNVFDFDQHDEQCYLVMEWLNGESVNSLLRRTSGRPLAPQFAWQVIEGIARGLQHAHSKNVVHADVNPSNIFITDTQEIKLLDFGVARYANEPYDLNADGTAWATRTYASPETLSGLPPTFGDDIFSLGCVAYRLLSGRHPFGGSSSLDARDAKLTPQAIPGLSETHWHILSRALAYEQSDRLDTVSAFFTDSPAAGSANNIERVDSRPTAMPWLAGLALFAVLLVVGAWWLWPGGIDDEAAINAETNPIGEPSIVDVEAALNIAALDALLSAATQAMTERRFVAPQVDNARDAYLDVLLLDPENSAALNGLRDISDDFVRQAETALRASDPASAFAALTIAAETDPENPAITIVDELLQAQANVVIANARLAIAAGDSNQARDLLLTAEQYPFLDPSAIDAVRQEIAQGERERRLSASLVAAEADLAAGRLTEPVDDNAQSKLLELQSTYGSEARVFDLAVRVTSQLLDRANSAIAEDRLPLATELLDAASGFGVLPEEIAAARTELQSAVEQARVASNAALEATATIVAESPLQQQVLSGAGGPLLPAENSSIQSGVLLGATGNSVAVAADLNADQDAQAPDAPPGEQIVAFSDLTVERYVAPKYPRRASEAGLTGAVELQFDVYADGSTGNIEVVRSEPRKVFIPSARSAVRQWRFEPRDDDIRAQVILRFDLAPEE